MNTRTDEERRIRHHPKLTVPQIARIIAKQIRQKVHEGDLPDHCYRVSSTLLRDGWVIDVTVTVDEPIWSAAHGCYLPSFQDLIATLDELLEESARNDHVTFSSHVQLLQAPR